MAKALTRLPREASLGHGRGVESPNQPRLEPIRRADVAVVFGLALAWFLLTLSPGLYWGDSASLASHLDTIPRPFARSYWLYKGAARLILLVGLRPVLAANVASALFGAFAVALAHMVTTRITGSRLAAAGAAAALAVAHDFWAFAVVTEVYTLLICFQLGLLLLALGARHRPAEAVTLGLLAGLSLNHHRLVLAGLVPLLLWLFLVTPMDRRRALTGRVLSGLAVGAIPLLVLCVLAPPSSLTPPQGVSPWRHWFDRALLGGSWSAGLLEAGAGKPLAANVAYTLRTVAFCFPSPALLLAPLGLFSLLRARRATGVLLTLLLVAFGAAGMRFGWTGDQYSFLLPLQPLVAILAGAGLALLPGRSVATQLLAASLLLPVPVYAGLAHGPPGELLLPRAGPTLRAELLWPGKAGYDLPERWCRARLTEVENDALLVSQWGEGTVFEYLIEIDGLRPDVGVVLHRAGPVGVDPAVRPTFLSWSPLEDHPPAAIEQTGLAPAPGRSGFRRAVRR